jgi:hypothetical protein
MGLIEGTLIFVASILVAAASRLIADDAKAWLPWVTEHLIESAVKRLPLELRERFAEEWRSHVADMPGYLGKLIVAVGFLSAAKVIAGKASAFHKAAGRVMAGLMLVLLAPLLVITSCLLSVTRRPILVKRDYVRRDGKHIQCLMFNTEFADSPKRLYSQDNNDMDHDKIANSSKLERMLHRTMLTHLPMLINMMRGELPFPGFSVFLYRHDA